MGGEEEVRLHDLARVYLSFAVIFGAVREFVLEIEEAIRRNPE